MSPSRYQGGRSSGRMDDPLVYDRPNAGYVVGLISDIYLAGKIAQSARQHGLNVHHFDRGDDLVAFVQGHKTLFIILDWDHREAESFKILKALRDSADLRRVPVIGYLSSAKQELVQEAERAGCDRVYGKTEFNKNLNDFMMRYAR